MIQLISWHDRSTEEPTDWKSSSQYNTAPPTFACQQYFWNSIVHARCRIQYFFSDTNSVPASNTQMEIGQIDPNSSGPYMNLDRWRRQMMMMSHVLLHYLHALIKSDDFDALLVITWILFYSGISRPKYIKCVAFLSFTKFSRSVPQQVPWLMLKPWRRDV